MSLTRPVLYGLRVYRSGVADDGKYHLYMSDDSANGTRLLGIDHRGAGDTQPFAIDVHNFPGARSAMIIHQYSGFEEGVQLDNTATKAMVVMRNTENSTNSPGTSGGGSDYFVWQGYTSPTTVTDGATTNASATLTSATAAFTSADVGKLVTGNGIPYKTFIQSVESSTSVTLTANATATASGVTVKIYRARGTQSTSCRMRFSSGRSLPNSVGASIPTAVRSL